ncbi:MAG: hypothetical protein ACTSWW_13460 [Promethearchaeota archaeon]
MTNYLYGWAGTCFDPSYIPFSMREKTDEGTLFLDDVEITSIETAGEFTDNDNHLMTSAAIQDKIQALLSLYSLLTHNHNLADLIEHSYNSLSDKPTIYANLADLLEKSYNNLTEKPSIPTQYTDALARIACVATTITNGVTTSAPNQNAVYDALAGKLGTTAKSADSSKLNGVAESEADTASTIAKRNASGDILARLFRSDYSNQSTISGAMAYRVSTSDNYIRFCNSPTAIKTWLGVPSWSSASSIYPTLNNINDLGKSDRYWDNLYINDIYMRSAGYLYFKDTSSHVNFRIAENNGGTSRHYNDGHFYFRNWSDNGYRDVYGDFKDQATPPPIATLEELKAIDFTKLVDKHDGEGAIHLDKSQFPDRLKSVSIITKDKLKDDLDWRVRSEINLHTRKDFKEKDWDKEFQDKKVWWDPDKFEREFDYGTNVGAAIAQNMSWVKQLLLKIEASEEKIAQLEHQNDTLEGEIAAIKQYVGMTIE